MAFRQTVITLGASATRLVLPTSAANVNRTTIRSFTLTAGPANGDPVFLGDVNVSATLWAHRIPAPAGGIPEAPYVPPCPPDGSTILEDHYLFGTAGEKVHVGVYTYE
jgi:hypothetical protein